MNGFNSRINACYWKTLKRLQKHPKDRWKLLIFRVFTGLPPRWRLHELFLMKKRIFPDAAHNSYVEKECVCVYSPSSRGARCLLPTGDCDAIGGLIGPRCVGGSPIGVLTRHRPFDWESNSRAAPPAHAAPAIPLPPRLGYTTDRALKTDGVYAAPGNVLVSKKTEN